jgi:hypothetical protein
MIQILVPDGHVEIQEVTRRGSSTTWGELDAPAEAEPQGELQGAGEAQWLPIATQGVL